MLVVGANSRKREDVVITRGSVKQMTSISHAATAAWVNFCTNLRLVWIGFIKQVTVVARASSSATGLPSFVLLPSQV